MFEYLVAGIFVFVGWYLTTNYAAFKDGVRNSSVFRCAWWPCYTATSVRTKVGVFNAAVAVHVESADDINKQMFALDCAIVVRNNIMRRNPNFDISTLKIQNREFESYVNSFHQKFDRVNR